MKLRKASLSEVKDLPVDFMEEIKVLYGRPDEELTPESAERINKCLEKEGFFKHLWEVSNPSLSHKDSIEASFSDTNVTPSSESANNPANIKEKEE